MTSAEAQLEQLGLLSRTLPSMKGKAKGWPKGKDKIPPASPGRRQGEGNVSPGTFPSVVAAMATANGKIDDVPLALIHRHKANRHPEKAAVDDVAASFAEHGQLEPVIVRRLPGAKETYELLSGETRFLAAKKLAWPTVRGRVVQCNDAQALRIVAIANAKRRDVNPLDRAELLKRLTDPIEKGGAGLTQQQAGDDVGLERATVSNEIRLLRLPHGIQTAIRDGRLPATFARELIGSADAGGGAVLEKVVAKVLKDNTSKDGELELDRTNFIEDVGWQLRSACRSMDSANQHDRTSDYSLKSCCGTHDDRLFEPGDEELRQLQPFKFGDKEYTANVEAWKKLQKAAAAELLGKLKSKSGKSADRKDAKSAKAQPARTPAQQKAIDKKMAEQLRRRVDLFRTDWLRVLVAARLNDSDAAPDPTARLASSTVALRLILWASVDMGVGHSNYYRRATFLGHVIGSGSWASIKKIDLHEIDGIPALFLAQLFCDKNGPTPLVPDHIVRDAAYELGIDLAKSWKKEQARSLTERYFGMLNRAQLVAHAKAWSIGINPAKKVSELQQQLARDPASKKSLPILLKGKK